MNDIATGRYQSPHRQSQEKTFYSNVSEVFSPPQSSYQHQTQGQQQSMKLTTHSTALKLRNHHKSVREQAVIVSGGDGEHGVNVKVKRLEREFATNGLPIVNYESKNNLKVINSSESDSEH